MARNRFPSPMESSPRSRWPPPSESRSRARSSPRASSSLWKWKKGYRFMFQFDVGCQSSESKNKRVSWFIQWILLKEKSRRDLEPIARYDTRYGSLPLFPPAKLLGFKRSSVGYHSNFSFCSLIPLNSYEKAFSSAGHKTWKVPRPEPDRNIKWQIQLEEMLA